LHFCSNSLTHETSRAATFAAAAIAADAGALVSFDVNYRAALWQSAADARPQLDRALSCAQIIKLSESELAFIAGSADPEAAHDLLRQDVRLVLLSAGAQGVHAIMRGAHLHVPAFRVTAVDTTGAGDALAAAVLQQVAGSPGILDD